MNTKTCPYCTNQFESKRHDRIYCSDQCKALAHKYSGQKGKSLGTINMDTNQNKQGNSAPYQLPAHASNTSSSAQMAMMLDPYFQLAEIRRLEQLLGQKDVTIQLNDRDIRDREAKIAELQGLLAAEEGKPKGLGFVNVLENPTIMENIAGLLDKAPGIITALKAQGGSAAAALGKFSDNEEVNTMIGELVQLLASLPAEKLKPIGAIVVNLCQFEENIKLIYSKLYPNGNKN